MMLRVRALALAFVCLAIVELSGAFWLGDSLSGGKGRRGGMTMDGKVSVNSGQSNRAGNSEDMMDEEGLDDLGAAAYDQIAGDSEKDAGLFIRGFAAGRQTCTGATKQGNKVELNEAQCVQQSQGK